jgi:indolepyruvate ferredoxin oxidoreductase
MCPADVSLDDKYAQPSGRIFLTGVQALVRLLLVQARRDRRAGLATRGFVSGYRGSPLGGFDQQLWRARTHLERDGVHFQPGLNEDLAATAVAGTQQVSALPGPRFDGVFALWYGKAPGVDRSGDALRHGHAAGSHPLGGVLAVAGDDHACKSSTLPSQSEHAFLGLGMPVLNPAGVQEVLDLGLLGFALSRHSGCWVGFIALADTMDSAASVDADEDRVAIVLPEAPAEPPGGRGFRVGRAPLEQEELLYRHRLEAALAFARANRLDRVEQDTPRARLGIAATGKAWLDLRQALEDLGIDAAGAAALGIRLYKVGMPWPLEPMGVRAFADGLDEILVVEEKRSLVESQIKEQLYDLAGPRPRVVGKRDERGAPLLPETGDLSPAQIARALASRLPPERRGERIRLHLSVLDAGERAADRAAQVRARTPFYCPGCPHNTSTKLPDGSFGIAGIGCHYMVRWMDRRTDVFSQMGGEGAHWIGQAPFTDTPHVFVNLGDGTYFHSGILAVRAAVAAGVDVTFKILVNDAVAMTGGQKLDGALSVARLSRQLHAEGVRRIDVVGEGSPPGSQEDPYAPGTRFHRRDGLDRVQRELRETPGTTALIFDRTCAAELRRRRKRGLAPEMERRVFIHPEVCEGCGDCSEQSNCVAIEPLDTEFGRKRAIHQSSCNGDEACLAGLCPALITVRGARPRRPPDRDAELSAALARLPEPPRPPLDRPWNAVVAGVGGTGIVTVGALLGMAAHLEGRAATTLDMTGLAQKGGAVLSHVRIGASAEALGSPRIGTASADLLLACDLLVAAGPETAALLGPARTRAVVDRHLAPTGEFVRDGDLDYRAGATLALLRERCAATESVDATSLASALVGDAVAANLFLLGWAWQRGLVPVALASLERAIELNGVAVEANRRALAWGRLAAADVDAVLRLARPAGPPADPPAQDLDAVIARRERHLVAYQGAALARRYRAAVERVRSAEARVAPGSRRLTEAVARGYHRVLTPKDEYEVARLHTDPELRRQLEAAFEGELKIELHLAPPLLARPDPHTGRPRKRRVGPWILPVLRGLARLRGLRGTPFDPFTWSAERRLERSLRREYEATLGTLLEELGAANLELAARIAALPEAIRGFGAVKAAAAERAAAERRRLLDRFLKPDPPPFLEEAETGAPLERG